MPSSPDVLRASEHAVHHRFFHGTAHDVQSLRTSERGTFGSGIYLTNHPHTAHVYGGENDDAQILELEVQISNPYVHHVREGEVIDSWGEGLVMDLFGPEVGGAMVQAAADAGNVVEQACRGDFGDEVTQELRRRGHDGLLAVFEPHEGQPNIEAVVFDEDRVRIVERWRYSREGGLVLARAPTGSRSKKRTERP